MLRIKWEVETLWTPEPMTGCFLWLGDGYASGYGRVGSSTDPWGGYVHRAVMHFAGVALERGLQRHVRHICDNRMCVNPSHLAYGTAADNVRDRSARWVREGKRWGHWLSGFPRKYGDEQIAGIRAAVNAGRPASAVAAEMGIPTGTIYGLLRTRASSRKT